MFGGTLYPFHEIDSIQSRYWLQGLSKYRSHFGSRYKSGPCFIAGLLLAIVVNADKKRVTREIIVVVVV